MNPDFTGLLAGLLENYSPTGSEAAAVAYLVDRMNSLGFTAAQDACGNAVGTRGAGPNEIMLLGHIDTVPRYYRSTPGRRCPSRARLSRRQRPPWRVLSPPPARRKFLADWCNHGYRRAGRRGRFAWRSLPAGSLLAPGSCHRRTPAVGTGSPSDTKAAPGCRTRSKKPLAHAAAQAANACEIAFQFWARLQAMVNDFNASYNKAFDQILPTLRNFSSSDGRFHPDSDPENWHPHSSYHRSGRSCSSRSSPWQGMPQSSLKTASPHSAPTRTILWCGVSSKPSATMAATRLFPSRRGPRI